MATEKQEVKDLEVTENQDGTAVVVLDDEPGAEHDTTVDDLEAGSKTEDEPSEEEEDKRRDAELKAEEAAATTDKERDAIRARRREERQSKKQRALDREEGYKRELANERAARQALEERMAVIDRRLSGNDLAQLDKSLSEAQNAQKYFEGLAAEATTAGRGQDAVQATVNMMEAKRRSEELTNVRQRVVQGANQVSAPRVDPRVIQHGQKWHEKNQWYRPNTNDADSQVMLTIDRAMAAEGWNPSDAAYWEELDKRKAKYLPHRKNDAILPGNTARRTSTPMSGSSRSASATGSGREFTLSAERVKSLKEAGLWEDPKQRAEMIREYRKYDRQAETAAASAKR